MKTKTIISIKDLYITLSRLISCDPEKQLDWVQKAIEGNLYKHFAVYSSIAEKEYDVTDLRQIQGYETLLCEAKLFMFVRTCNYNFQNGKFLDVVFLDSLSNMEDIFKDMFMPTFTEDACWYNLFYFNKTENEYLTLKFDYGLYKNTEQRVYIDLEKEHNLVGPIKLFPDNIRFHEKLLSNDWSPFIEVSNLYRFEREKQIGCDTYITNDENISYCLFGNLDSALKHAKMILIQERVFDVIVVSNRWYDFFVYIDKENLDNDEDACNSALLSYSNSIVIEATAKFVDVQNITL